MKKNFQYVIFTILVLFLVVSCKTKGPIVIREKEYVLISNYCSLNDFSFNPNDLLNSDEVSLNNILIDENDTVSKELILNKNIINSPDKKYYVEYSYVPSRNNFFAGTCNANIYNKDKILITIIKNVRQHEAVLWFKDFVIFEGYGNEFSRKVILDLNTGFVKEIGLIANSFLIGKSISSAFYESYTAGAMIGTAKTSTKYSVIRLSKNDASVVYEANNNQSPFLYNDNISVIYNSVTDSFNLFLDKTLKFKFKSSADKILFDKLNCDSSNYVLINNSIYKIDNGYKQLSALRAISNKKLDIIKDFRVLDNKVIFQSLHKITEVDVSDLGEYTTKNKMTFNIKDTNFAGDKSFSGYISEFGILDIKSQMITYPILKIIK